MTAGDSLGDRIKRYEAQETYERFLPNTPIVARIDGRCFGRFTKRMHRPFDERFSVIMRNVTARLVKETGACIGYTQSDEISLCWYNPTPGSDIFFGGRKFKMVGQLAALATAYFHIECSMSGLGARVQEQAPTFDARVFAVPNLMEGVNAILWRQRDCLKNSTSMIARAFFSHKELLNKNQCDMIEMLSSKSVSLDDYPWQYREGTFIQKKVVRRRLTEIELAAIPKYRRSQNDEEVCRSQYVEIQIPLLSKLSNSIDVIFFGANPLPKEEV
jgi:tRNA(His) 5'-end guanylyltransferase